MIGVATSVELVVGAPTSESRSGSMDEVENDLADVVRRARRNERAAYATLYVRFSKAVHAAVLARAPYGDAEDAVQEAFLTAWRRLDTLSEGEAFGGWILQIARNTAIDQRRRVRPSQELDPETGAPDPPTAEAQEVLAAIRALPEAYRETLVMRLVEGMTGPEIAAATGMHADSVRVNLCRGMKLLRAKLGSGQTT